VECSDENIGFKALVFAAGVRRRTLSAVRNFTGSGVMISGSGEKRSVEGESVVIVGGGDAALENALILGEYANEVTVVHRGEEFSARAEFIEKAKKMPNVKFLMRNEIAELNGVKKLESVTAKSRDGENKIIEADRILIRIGTQPNSELLRGIVATDAAGFIITDITGATSQKNIYAAGDVANPTSPTIITAAGTAAAAAKAAFQPLSNSSH
jgi:thioredoxin reductase (NADPH)